jgi:adenylate kinase
MYQTLLLIGPPGSGKGTIGKKLAAVTHYLHLSSGEIFRSVDKESEMGRLQRAYIDKGQLVPDEMTVKIVLNYIQQLIDSQKFSPESQKIILDGFPRTLKQAKMMQEAFVVNQVIVLEVSSKQVLFDRLKNRGQIEGRADDMKEEVLEKRYAVYKAQTEVLLNFYPKKSQLLIYADQNPEAVFKDVLVALGHS